MIKMDIYYYFSLTYLFVLLSCVFISPKPHICTFTISNLILTKTYMFNLKKEKEKTKTKQSGAHRMRWG